VAGYRLIHRLGAGGMGEAWLAEREGDLGVNLICVLKIVRPTSGDLENAQRRFIEEARMLSLLNHNNISRIVDVGSSDGELYLAVEHVFGVDLQSMLRQLGPQRIPQPLVIHIVRELLSALEHTHTLEHPVTGAPMNLVHRDVSPKNVMVTFDGAVKLIDFGIATSALHPKLTAVHEVVGTLAYMAPEQIRGERLDGRSDLYALGAMLYEMVLGARYVKSSEPSELARQLATGLFKPARMGELLPETAAVV
jgi:eukaryotic-like serine/threonine-protein kinase